MKKTPTIIQTMDGPFRPFFKGKSWDGWRAVLKACAALPMSPEEVEFFKSVAGGREPPRKKPREVWIVAGRRAGKDSAISLIAAHAAATFDARVLRPGERALVCCTAPSREIGGIVQQYISALFEAVPSLKKMKGTEVDELLPLKNRVDVAVMSSNFRSIRGRPILCAILDEVAFLPRNDSAAPDVELLNAILPGMATIPEAQLFGISSPHAKAGVLYQRYAKYFGQNDDDVLVIQAPSHVLNPSLDTGDRDRAMAEDPARAAAEWLAEFRTDLVAFIDPMVVARAVVKDRPELLPVPGIKYVAAVDPSGGSSDSMTLAIAHAENDRVVLDLVREFTAPFSPEKVVSSIIDDLRRFGITSTIGDRYAGEWAREPFRLRGVEYEIASLTRSEAYLEMLPLLNSGRIELLDVPRLISQLNQLERRTTRSGKDDVNHPRGGHDDVINAAALALIACGGAHSSADGWLEFMRRQLQRAGVDTDNVRASGPAFGFEFNAKAPEPVIKMFVPPAIVAGGGNGVPIDGVRHGYKFEGGRAYVELPHAAARQLLSYEFWRAANPGPAFDLLGGTAT